MLSYLQNTVDNTSAACFTGFLRESSDILDLISFSVFLPVSQRSLFTLRWSINTVVKSDLQSTNLSFAHSVSHLVNKYLLNAALH